MSEDVSVACSSPEERIYDPNMALLLPADLLTLLFKMTKHINLQIRMQSIIQKTIRLYSEPLHNTKHYHSDRIILTIVLSAYWA